jgi:hypothetical protein
MEGSILSDLMVVFLQYNIWNINTSAAGHEGRMSVGGNLRRQGRGFFDILTAPGSRTGGEKRKRPVRTEPENATVASSYATPCQTVRKHVKAAQLLTVLPESKIDTYMHRALICT